MEDSASHSYVFDEFTLAPARACLLRNRERVDMRPKAFDTLLYLVEHAGRVTTKDELIRAIWPKVVVTEDSLVKSIREARDALGDAGHRYIRTIPRRGYLFDAQVTVETSTFPERHGSSLETPTDTADPGAPTPYATAGTARASPARRTRLVLLVTAAAGLAAVLIGAAIDYLAAGPGAGTQVQSPSARASIAVLPFISIGPDSGEDYFSDGVSEELMNVLANVPGLHVPSRTSSFTFKGTHADVRTIAAALNVDHVLEGSVRKDGARVRITAQLIDVTTDSHLWSATFERELTDIFAIQREIARSVAAALQIELLGTELAIVADSPTRSMEAHDAYLRGMHYRRMQRLADNAKVRQSFRRAIELDPRYAAAYAGLAMAVSTALTNGTIDRDAGFVEAEDAITRALALDPKLALAYAAQGQVERLKGNYAGADAEFRRAINLQPSLADAHFSRMYALGALGRFDEARASLARALELDPLNGFFNRWMGNVQLALGSPAQARIYDERAVEFEPSQPNAYAGLGDIAIATGHVDEALSWYLKGVAGDPGHAHITAIVGEIYLSLGDRERAQPWFEKAASLYQLECLSRFFREFMPVDGPPADAGALLALLREVPADQFIPLGSRVFRKAVLQTGRIADAEGFYRKHWPELFEAQPLVNANNFGAATDVAWLHLAHGEEDRANVLLELALEIFRDPRQRNIDPPEWSVGLVEIEALALQGRKTEALAALRRAIDAGWRVEWWQVEHDPTLGSISNEPEFRAMIAEVKADLARQLEHVRAMERSSEIDGMPQAAAASR